jgi:hypothetical protein
MLSLPMPLSGFLQKSMSGMNMFWGYYVKSDVVFANAFIRILGKIDVGYEHVSGITM